MGINRDEIIGVWTNEYVREINNTGDILWNNTDRPLVFPSVTPANITFSGIHANNVATDVVVRYGVDVDVQSMTFSPADGANFFAITGGDAETVNGINAERTFSVNTIENNTTIVDGDFDIIFNFTDMSSRSTRIRWQGVPELLGSGGDNTTATVNPTTIGLGGGNVQVMFDAEEGCPWRVRQSSLPTGVTFDGTANQAGVADSSGTVTTNMTVAAFAAGGGGTFNLDAITQTGTGDAVQIVRFEITSPPGTITTGDVSPSIFNIMVSTTAFSGDDGIDSTPGGNTSIVLRRDASSGVAAGAEGQELWARIGTGNTQNDFTLIGTLTDSGGNGDPARIRILGDSTDVDRVVTIPEFSDIFLAPAGGPTFEQAATRTLSGVIIENQLDPTNDFITVNDVNQQDTNIPRIVEFQVTPDNPITGQTITLIGRGAGGDTPYTHRFIAGGTGFPGAILGGDASVGPGNTFSTYVLSNGNATAATTTTYVDGTTYHYELTDSAPGIVTISQQNTPNGITPTFADVTPNRNIAWNQTSVTVQWTSNAQGTSERANWTVMPDNGNAVSAGNITGTGTASDPYTAEITGINRNLGAQTTFDVDLIYRGTTLTPAIVITHGGRPSVNFCVVDGTGTGTTDDDYVTIPWNMGTSAGATCRVIVDRNREGALAPVVASTDDTIVDDNATMKAPIRDITMGELSDALSDPVNPLVLPAGVTTLLDVNQVVGVVVFTFFAPMNQNGGIMDDDDDTVDFTDGAVTGGTTGNAPRTTLNSLTFTETDTTATITANVTVQDATVAISSVTGRALLINIGEGAAPSDITPSFEEADTIVVDDSVTTLGTSYNITYNVVKTSQDRFFYISHYVESANGPTTTPARTVTIPAATTTAADPILGRLTSSAGSFVFARNETPTISVTNLSGGRDTNTVPGNYNFAWSIDGPATITTVPSTGNGINAIVLDTGANTGTGTVSCTVTDAVDSSIQALELSQGYSVSTGGIDPF